MQTPTFTPNDLNALIALVDAAGTAIMTVYTQETPITTHWKDDQSPLTQADQKAHDILHAGLQHHWPDIPVLSEEGQSWNPQHATNLYWAVDPLDGTKEFLKRNGEFTVNVAIVAQGRPILGVVYAPVKNWLYTGFTADLPGEPTQARKRSPQGWENIRSSGFSGPTSTHRPTRVAMSRSHPSPELAQWLEPYQPIERQDIGSSLKFCLVAEGSIDVYPRLGPTCIWDTAAGHAIVEAAGGRVCGMDGQPLRYVDPSHTLNGHFIAWGG